MKTIFTFLLLLFALPGFTANNQDSITNAKIEKLIKTVAVQDSTIKALGKKTEEIDIKKDFFSDELSMQTTFYSLLVAILTSIVAFVLPYFLNKKFKKEFKRMQSELKKQEEIIKKTNLKLNFDTTRLIVQNYLDRKLSYYAYRWGIKQLLIEREYKNNTQIPYKRLFFIRTTEQEYHKIAQTIHRERTQLLEEVNDINKDLKYLLEFVEQKYKQNVIDFQTKFNQIIWDKMGELTEAESSG